MKETSGKWIIEGEKIILLNNDFQKIGEVKKEHLEAKEKWK